MKRSRRNALAAVALAVALATVAIAEQSSTEHSQRRLQWLQTKLGLSADQAKAVQAAYATDQDTRQQLRSQLRPAMADFRQSALNGADASTLQTKRDAIQQLTGQLLDLRGKELVQIGSVLTPDQRSAFAALKGPGRGGHGHWQHKPGSDSTPADE
jgi:heavy-metal resistance protein